MRGSSYDVIVVGGGAMGSAATYHLTRDGRSVLLLEQFEIGHARGSTHGHSRIIRLSYDHPTYVRLAQAAYWLWAELAEEAHQPLVLTTGGLDLGEPDNPTLRACLDSLRRTNVPYEVLTARAVRRRFPQFHIGDEIVGLYQADAGILNPTQCVMLMAQQAARCGASVIDRTPVRSIQLDGAGATIITGNATYHCEKLILSAGAWTGPLLASIGVSLPLTVTQEQYAYFEPRQPDAFRPDRFPIFIHYASTTGPVRIDTYGFPIYGRDGVKAAEHHAGPLTTAEARTFEVDPARLKRLSESMQAILPEAYGEVIRAATCLYTNTPDNHFIIDTLPDHPQVAVTAGFSGHGFKFSILMGRILADLVERGRTEYPIEMFSMKRGT